LSTALSKLSDLERLAVRVTSSTICPKDLIAVQTSLQELPLICDALHGTVNRYLSELSSVPEDLVEFADRIASSIASDAPRELTEGGILFVAITRILTNCASFLVWKRVDRNLSTQRARTNWY